MTTGHTDASSSVLACATERVPPPPLPISPALSLTVSSKRHRQRVRVCPGTTGEATGYTVSTPRQEGDLYCYMAKKGLRRGVCGEGGNK